MGYVDAAQLRKLAEPLKNNTYGQYLQEIADGESSPLIDDRRRRRREQG